MWPHVFASFRLCSYRSKHQHPLNNARTNHVIDSHTFSVASRKVRNSISWSVRILEAYLSTLFSITLKLQKYIYFWWFFPAGCSSCFYRATGVRWLAVGPSLWLACRWPGTHYQTVCKILHVNSTVLVAIWKLFSFYWRTAHHRLCDYALLWICYWYWYWQFTVTDCLRF